MDRHERPPRTRCGNRLRPSDTARQTALCRSPGYPAGNRSARKPTGGRCAPARPGSRPGSARPHAGHTGCAPASSSQEAGWACPASPGSSRRYRGRVFVQGSSQASTSPNGTCTKPGMTRAEGGKVLLVACVERETGMPVIPAVRRDDLQATGNPRATLMARSMASPPPTANTVVASPGVSSARRAARRPAAR